MESKQLIISTTLRKKKARWSQIATTLKTLNFLMHYHMPLPSMALLEKKYDSQFKIVFDALRESINPPAKPRRKIGFEGKT